MAIIAAGEVLLEGAPSDSLAAIEGQIWARVAEDNAELRAIESEHRVVSTRLIGGKHEVRVFAASKPGDGFRQISAVLDDVYFLQLARHASN
jgi:hypothetical protein